MKAVLFSMLAFAFSLQLKAETVECKARNSSSFSLKFSTSQPPTTPASLKAKLKTGFFSGTKDLSLKVAPRNNQLNYTDYWNPKSFWLSMGEYRGLGHYSNVSFSLKEPPYVSPYESSSLPPIDQWIEHKYILDCDLSGPMEFQNYCETSSGSNPQANLFYAVEHMNVDLLEATLPCGIDVNALGAKNCSPLLMLTDVSCGTGQFDPYANYDIKDMVSDLVTAGSHLDAQDPVTGETSLMKLARRQDLASSQILLDAKADINAQDKEGMTTLMRAVEQRYLKMVSVLVASGANLKLKNNSGKTALDIATDKGYKELFETLSGVTTMTVQGDKNGICTPMNFTLKLNQANKVVLKTLNSMLMLTSKDLNISLMAASGMDAETTITPTKAGSFMMNCGPQMGDGNPMGMVTVQ